VVFVIANDLKKMQIDSNISEADVGTVTEGKDVDFLVDAFPSTTFQGKVVQVRNSPTTVQNVVTYDAVISVSNPESKLKPGMTANLSIIIAHHDDMVQIPNAAFRVRLPQDLAKAAGMEGSLQTGKPSHEQGAKKKDGDPALRVNRTVFVLPDGAKVPKPVKIKVGITDGINTEVTEGLKEGDKVLVSVFSSQPSNGTSPAANPFAPRR
jgi:HlyD family secretion protein